MIPRTTLHKVFLLAGVLILLAGGFFYWDRITGAFLPSPKARALLNEGKLQASDGHFQKALRSYRAVPRQYPDAVEAPLALMEAAKVLDLYLDRPYESIHAYLLVIRDYPLTSAAGIARKNIADIYKNRLRDYEQASVYYQRVLERDFIRKDIIQYELADCYFRLNNFEQSRIELETFLVNYPKSPLFAEVRFRLGAAYALENNFAKAEETFAALARDYPDKALAVEARFEIGMLLARQEKLKKSLEVLRELKGKYPRPEVLKQSIEQIRERIRKKKKAI